MPIRIFYPVETLCHWISTEFKRECIYTVIIRYGFSQSSIIESALFTIHLIHDVDDISAN